ncbi:5-formyltetrahydrofolate cyclo-ligase [Rhizobiales bacterium GAS113]|nr:5-formyltetrahydrofolate cyclo-ligase [Rhizobiales bacterium GAS113]
MQAEDAALRDAKAAIRKAALARRDGLDAEARLAASRLIAAGLSAVLAPLGVAHLGGATASGFWPIRSELDPRPLMRELAAEGALLALPCIEAGALVFRRFAFGDRLRNVGFGLSQPPPEAEAVSPDLMLVPLAAFDRKGGRIGYGKGYYDGAIARLAASGARPLKLGLAFACQEAPAIPMEPHDQRLDAILTEHELIVVRVDGE